MPSYETIILAWSISLFILFFMYRAKDKSLSESEGKNKTLQREIDSLKNELSNLKKKHAELTKEYDAATSKLSYLSKLKKTVEKQKEDFHSLFEDHIQLKRELARHSENLETLLSSQKASMPWLAGMIADFMTYDLELEAKKLEWGHNVQREKKVASIREIRAEATQRIKENREAFYQLSYLRELYPSVDAILSDDYKPDLPQSVTSGFDPARSYLSSEEWHRLPQAERDQLALDRYVHSHSKSKWQIGRDYELSVGYEYIQKGYQVDTHGSYMGLRDLGRDIIASGSDRILIIQCKHWSESKTIHEKHIYQLYGTTISFQIEHPDIQVPVCGVFVTTASLSPVAKKAAKMLGISVVEHHKMIDFPRIKCNIGHNTSGSHSMIYHLPMDDQYDTTKIDKPGEFYAFTVQEAVEKGFRRAYGWHNHQASS